METVRILVLAGMRPRLQRRLYEAQYRKLRACGRCVVDSIWLPAKPIPAGRIVTISVPPTKGQFALHSQTVQMITHAFLANVETARELRPPIARSALPLRTSASTRCSGLRRR